MVTTQCIIPSDPLMNLSLLTHTSVDSLRAEIETAHPTFGRRRLVLGLYIDSQHISLLTFQFSSINIYYHN